MPAVDDADVRVILARADAVDGTTDKVVSKCLMCSFAMDGKAEHASTVEGYTLHLCGTHCKEAFDKDPVARLQMTRLP